MYRTLRSVFYFPSARPDQITNLFEILFEILSNESKV